MCTRVSYDDELEHVIVVVRHDSDNINDIITSIIKNHWYII